MGRLVRIGQRAIGEEKPCFIIAEIGSNHNGSLGRAKQLIDVAVDAGADAAKFQLFRARRLYPRRAGTCDYLKIARPIYDIIREMELPYAWVPRLAQYCEDRGIVFFVSVFDEESVERVDRYVAVHKIASYELTHLPLVRHVARKGKPMILSTGAATLAEVREAVKACHGAGNHHLLLMQCTAAYPAPLESLNIRSIATMKAAFGVPVGLSDHSRDPVIGPLTAVAAGANLLEKHVTISNTLPGPDHRFAVEPGELRLMVKRIRTVEQALGHGTKAPHPVEAELRRFARRSIFAVRAIRQGQVITTHDVSILRNGHQPPGLPPHRWDEVLGRRARREIRPEEPITERVLQ